MKERKTIRFGAGLGMLILIGCLLAAGAAAAEPPAMDAMPEFYDQEAYVVTEIQNSGGSDYQYDYDAVWRCVCKRNVGVFDCNYVYTQSGENTLITYEPETNMWVQELRDSNGALLREQEVMTFSDGVDTASVTTTKVMNADGTRKSIQTDSGDQCIEILFSYEKDANGRITKETQKCYQSSHSGDGAQHEPFDAGEITYEYTYDAAGNLTMQQDSKGNVTTNTYDAAGRLVENVDPQGLQTVYHWNSAGKLERLSESTGREETYTYDAAGRLTRVDFSNDSKMKSLEYTYDEHGNEIQLVVNGGSNVRSFVYQKKVPVQNEPPKISQPIKKLRYTDVAESAWYFENVWYVDQKALMNGVSDTLFAPDGTCTRAMVATILYRMAGKPQVSGTSGFSDVAEGLWYTDAVNWACKNGVVAGYDSITFGPSDPVTREQLAVLLWRFSGYLNESNSDRADLSSFQDSPSSWAAEGVAWAVAAGLMEGKGNGRLDPGGKAGRAEIAALVNRFYGME